MILAVIGLVAAAVTVEVKPEPGALEKARDRVRAELRTNAVARAEGVEVVLADGLYRLERPLWFTAADGGSESVPVVWRGAHRGKAVITGAAAAEPVAIDWTRSPASLVPAEVRSQVMAYRIGGTAPIPGWRNGWRMGASNETPIQVHLDGRRCKVATWPRKEYARTGQPVGKIQDHFNEWGENWYAAFDGSFHLKGEKRLAVWAKEPDLWSFGMWRFEWCATTAPVTKVDPVAETISVCTNQNPYGFLPNVPFNLFNAFSEIREPGDWAVDRATRTLYLHQGKSTARPEVSLTVHLINGTIHDAVFQDLVFEHSRMHAIQLHAVNRLTVRASLFRGIGETAINFGGDSRSSVIHGCDFEDLAKGAVTLSGGDQKTLTAASNVVENCHIHHFGVVSPIANPAISMSGTGNRAEHNLIHHFAHQGIVYIGNDHYCGFNILHDGVQYNNDAGMIYCGSYDWSRRGSVCEYNCVFMAGKQPLSSHVQGIYMDGWTSGVTVRGNIVNRASQGVYMSGGNDNQVLDNLVLNCPRGINLSSLGADSFAKGAALQGEKSFLYKKLVANAELYRTELWRTRYPRLLDLLAMPDKTAAHNAYWYVCTGNVTVCAATHLRIGNEEKVRPTHVISGNLDLQADPGFVDYEGFNWELKPDAPARKALPNGTRFAEMGLYDSPWRYSPAVKHGEGMSKPRPLRTEFDQGEVTISVIVKGRGRWHQLGTATPEWRQVEYEEEMKEDVDCQIGLIGGMGYKTMYDDVTVEGHPEVNGTFEPGGKAWTWNKEMKPSSMGEKDTPHGVVETPDAASGRFAAFANDRNPVISPVFKMKSGEKLRVTFKARQAVPEHLKR